MWEILSKINNIGTLYPVLGILTLITRLTTSFALSIIIVGYLKIENIFLKLITVLLSFIIGMTTVFYISFYIPNKNLSQISKKSVVILKYSDKEMKPKHMKMIENFNKDLNNLNINLDNGVIERKNFILKYNEYKNNKEHDLLEYLIIEELFIKWYNKNIVILESSNSEDKNKKF